MVVDGKGKIFEDRRSQTSERRKNEIDKTGGRRKEERRKAPEQTKASKK